MDKPQPYFAGPSVPRRGRHSSPLYRCEWGQVVGDRIRRLRRERGLMIVELARQVQKPEGGHYSLSYISRIERGWASATLYAYVAIAAALDVDPGKLLGPDNVAVDADPGDLVLLQWMRARGLAPHEVIVALTAAQPTELPDEGVLVGWEDEVREDGED